MCWINVFNQECSVSAQSLWRVTTDQTLIHGRVPAGLQAEQWVHHYPESFAWHHKGLLEDDLGPQRSDHRIAAGDTNRRGEDVFFSDWIQVCTCRPCLCRLNVCILMLTESKVKLHSAQNISQQNIAAALSWITEAARTEALRRKWGFLSVFVTWELVEKSLTR